MDNQNNKNSIFYTRLVGDVNEKSIKEVMKDIDTANSLDHVEEIVVTISSRGGMLYEGFALYEHIKASSKPIDIIAEGYCMSAAVMILQAGRKRSARPLTTFMIHPSNMSQEEGKPYNEILTIVEAYKRNHDLFIKLTIERAKVSREEVEKLYEPRKYLSAKQALEMGLIDEIKEK